MQPSISFVQQKSVLKRDQSRHAVRANYPAVMLITAVIDGTACDRSHCTSIYIVTLGRHYGRRKSVTQFASSITCRLDVQFGLSCLSNVDGWSNNVLLAHRDPQCLHASVTVADYR